MRIRRLLTGKESVAGSRGTAFLFLAMGVLVICAIFAVSNSTRTRASAQAPQPTPSTDNNGAVQVIGESDARQHLLFHPAPIVPPIARAAHVAGDVRVTIVISPDGKLIEANAVSGPTMLLHAAVDAVNKWQFTPFSVNGTPAQVTTTLTIPVVQADAGTAPEQNQQAAQDNNPPDMSCTYYDPQGSGQPGSGRPGTCEVGENVSGHVNGQYQCRNDEHKQEVEMQVGCEWKVKRFQQWEQQQHDTDKK